MLKITVMFLVMKSSILDFSILHLASDVRQKPQGIFDTVMRFRFWVCTAGFIFCQQEAKMPITTSSLAV